MAVVQVALSAKGGTGKLPSHLPPPPDQTIWNVTGPPSLLNSIHTKQPAPEPNWLAQLLETLPEPEPEDPTQPYERFRHSGWKPLRERTLQAMIDAGLSERTIERFKTCGQGAHVYYSQEANQHFLQASFCKCRGCVPCQKARQAQIAGNLAEWIKDRTCRFLTLTLKHTGETLERMLRRARRCFRDLRQTPEWKQNVTGYAAFIETKWNGPLKGWHVHWHILAEGLYWPQQELSRTWLSVTGNSPIVHVEAVQPGSGAANYVAKYATKPFDHDAAIDPVVFAEAVRCMHRTRLWEIGGTWKGRLKLLAHAPLPKDLKYVASMTLILAEATNGTPWAVAVMKSLFPHPLQERAPP